jgi:2-octaprenyl-3-methyl-6-methoxy-1,4-benzoquinol hydroxylase/2-octaprenylphenol hydroxylase
MRQAHEQAHEDIHDVLVIGAGMVGAAAACLLARAGFSVAVIEAREPSAFEPEAPVGLRVSAISPGSETVLAEAGAWRQVEQNRHCPYRRMRVEDRDSSAVIEFTSGQFGMERLGTIVENELLQWSLWQCLRSLAGVRLIGPAQIEAFDLGRDQPVVQLQGGQEICARLLVGADGAESAVRKELGTGVRYWSYGQQGIVAVVKTAVANSGLAWQRFLPGGPLAFLPLADGGSSIVWSCPDIEARRLLDLDREAFCAELEAATTSPGANATGRAGVFGSILGCGPRAAFPLNMQLSDTYAARRAVLIGDAAHLVHPLAGQGVNLGLMDAAALVETVIGARKEGEDIGSDRVLQPFARSRRSEAELMAHGIHGIRSLFMPEFLRPLRRLGLGLVSRSWSLQEAFIRRAAGRHRSAPALARGVGLNQIVHDAVPKRAARRA